MNNNATTILGLGAIGTLLAYYGYNYLDDDNDNETIKENQTEENQTEENQTQENEAQENEADKNNNIASKNINDHENNTTSILDNTNHDISQNSIKLEVKEQISKTCIESKENKENKENNTDKWSNYWEKQYNEIDKKQDIAAE